MIINAENSNVKKLVDKNKRLILFLEKYYGKRIGKKVKIVIRYSANAQTYIDIYTKKCTVYISAQMLQEELEEFGGLGFSLFYTLLMHEIGHAIYTGGMEKQSTIHNILEDARIEKQIEKWNGRVRFDLLRMAYIDKKFGEHPLETVLKLAVDKDTIALALFRIIQRKKLEKILIAGDPERELIIKKIRKLESKYIDCDTEIGVLENSLGYTQDVISENLIKLAGEVEKEIEKLLMKLTMPTNKSKSKSNKSKDIEPDGEKGGCDSDDDELDKEEQEEARIRADYMTKFANGNQIEEEINKMPSINVLDAGKPDTDPYTHYQISAFVAQRRSGIKGAEKFQRSTGNPQQLSLQRYARRNYVINEKYFDKYSEIPGVGKGTEIIFYLDISSSMTYRFSSKLNDTSLKILTDYVKSFYDVMSKYIKIRFFAFGKHTYELTRDELNYTFLHSVAVNEGDTRPTFIPAKRNEEIFIVTDGGFGTSVPREYLLRAHFIFIGECASQAKRLGIKHYISVDTEHLAAGLDKATAHIKNVLTLAK